MSTFTVPFQLRRRPERFAPMAFLLRSDSARELLAVCAPTGTEVLPTVFRVAGGFLVIPEGRFDPPAGVVPLRRLSENCYLPADADLIPTLLPDEAVALTRDRGLVFLPHGECFGFDSNQPIDVARLLRLPKPQRREWSSFPRPPQLADELRFIARTVPEVTPEDVLGPGGEGIGDEQPERPPKAGPLKSLGGKIAFGVGKGLAGLGAALGAGGLAKLGAKIMGKAAQAVPRLTESILGKQEAALRELLRKFRDGKIDEALRRALPMGGNDSGGAVPHSGADLPTHDTRWSLGHIFGGGGGPASVWITPEEIQRQLRDEYRKAAQAAIDAGDFRRAAFIFGKLLGDVRTAADVLAKGGLHRDAALLFRDVVKDERAAAREFEAAGDFEEALRLLRLVEEFEKAGDLLRRMGEEDAAIDEYHRAAQRLVERQKDYVNAGELMLRKTGRADLAGAYYATGWQEREGRGGATAIPCALRLAEIYAFATPLDPFWKHLDEAEEWLAPSKPLLGPSQFFNLVAKLADQPHLAEHRPALRDRARMGLARKLVQHGEYESQTATAVSDLFGQHPHWPAAVVSDAAFARNRRRKEGPKVEPEKRPFETIRLGYFPVTATVQAADSGDVFVGLTDGSLVSFDPRSRRLRTLNSELDGGPIEAIAADAAGRYLVTIQPDPRRPGEYLLRSYIHNEGELAWVSTRDWEIPDGAYVLNPVIDSEPIVTCRLSTTVGCVEFRGAALIPHKLAVDSDDADSLTHLSLHLGTNARVEKIKKPVLVSGASDPLPPAPKGDRIEFRDQELRWGRHSTQLNWHPDSPNLPFPPLSWLFRAADEFEVAGIVAKEGQTSALWWSYVNAPADSKANVRTLCSSAAPGYRAVALWGPGRLVAVTEYNVIHFLHPHGTELVENGTPVVLPHPAKTAACFASRATNEIVVILEDGEAVMVPYPGG